MADKLMALSSFFALQAERARRFDPEVAAFVRRAVESRATVASAERALGLSSGGDVHPSMPGPCCDICKAPLLGAVRFDGATVMGPWATMCAFCFGLYGVGLGAGRGQMFGPDGRLIDGGAK